MNSTPSVERAASADFSYDLGCADFFRLMSMFYLNPSEELAQGIIDKSIVSDLCAIFEEVGLDPHQVSQEDLGEICAQNLSVNTLRTQLRQDYTTLFTHPKNPLISLYEMQFRDLRDKNDMPSTLFLNEAALHAEQCYREAGLTLSDAHSREPGDHIAIELEFMAYLHTQRATAYNEQDSAAQERWGQALVTFTPHITNWGLDFFAACEHSGCGTVYPWLGKIGGIFLAKYCADNPAA